MKTNGKYTDLDVREIDSFDLEQKIMEAWHVVDDLRLLKERLEHMNADQVFSVVHGMEIFADMRFNSLWDTFEQYLKNARSTKDDSDSDTITLIDLDTNVTMDIDTEFVLHENP